MGKGRNLGELEYLVLLALLRLGDDAYGMTVRRELETTAGRPTTIGSVYATLERLEEKGFVSSRRADPNPSRGGHPRRFFTVERAGERALAETRDVIGRMWEGVTLTLERE